MARVVEFFCFPTTAGRLLQRQGLAGCTASLYLRRDARVCRRIRKRTRVLYSSLMGAFSWFHWADPPRCLHSRHRSACGCRGTRTQISRVTTHDRTNPHRTNPHRGTSIRMVCGTGQFRAASLVRRRAVDYAHSPAVGLAGHIAAVALLYRAAFGSARLRPPFTTRHRQLFRSQPSYPQAFYLRK